VRTTNIDNVNISRVSAIMTEKTDPFRELTELTDAGESTVRTYVADSIQRAMHKMH